MRTLVVVQPRHLRDLVVRGRRRVDISRVSLDGVVVFVVLVHIGIHIDTVGLREAHTTIVARRTAHGGTTVTATGLTIRRVGTAERSTDNGSRTTHVERRNWRTGVYILVLEVDRVVILVGLVHIGVGVYSE